MLNDPLDVLYDGATIPVPRALARRAVPGGITSSFSDVVSGLSVVINRQAYSDLSQIRTSVVVRKDYFDSDPTDGIYRPYGNGVGLIYDTDVSGYASSDLDKLRSAVLALVDPSIGARLISGEG